MLLSGHYIKAESNESSNEAAPENLSLPKRRDTNSPTEPERSRLPSNYPSFSSFLETSAAAAAAAGANSTGRSAVDVLRRVFPYKRRVDIENVLQRCNGDVLHAIELMVRNHPLHNVKITFQRGPPFSKTSKICRRDFPKHARSHLSREDHRDT